MESSHVSKKLKTELKPQVKMSKIQKVQLEVNAKKQSRLYKQMNFEKKLKKLREKERNATEHQDSNTAVESIPSLNKGRDYTVSIAVPGSILDNAQSDVLETLLAGQIARAASVFCVDEVIVFDDSGITRSNVDDKTEEDLLDISSRRKACFKMVRILQYLECPQYLRKYLMPFHKDLQNAGALYPLDCPHHLRENEYCVYREGWVTNKPLKKGGRSFAYIGLRKDICLDKGLKPGVRVTVKLQNPSENMPYSKGIVVSPHEPRTKEGLYWGYDVRLAHSLGTVFTGCPFEGGYDVTIGTSDKGEPFDDQSIPKFKHMLIVFGGLKGLESSLEADEALRVTHPKYLFDFYVNSCPEQGSRTIRTEEAVLVTLSLLRPKIKAAQNRD